MATMIRGNCEFTVAEHLVGEYLKKGYSLLDANGNVVQQSEPQNIGDYKRLVKQYKDKIVNLESERDELIEANSKLTERIKSLEDKINEPADQGKPTPEKPKATSAKK